MTLTISLKALCVPKFKYLFFKVIFIVMQLGVKKVDMKLLDFQLKVEFVDNSMCYRGCV